MDPFDPTSSIWMPVLQALELRSEHSGTCSRSQELERFALRRACANLPKRWGSELSFRQTMAMAEKTKRVSDELRAIVGAFYTADQESRLRSVLLLIDNELYTCDTYGRYAMQDFGPHRDVERAKAFLQMRFGTKLIYTKQKLFVN